MTVNTKYRPHGNQLAVRGPCQRLPPAGEKGCLRVKGLHRCARERAGGHGAEGPSAAGCHGPPRAAPGGTPPPALTSQTSPGSRPPVFQERRSSPHPVLSRPLEVT